MDVNSVVQKHVIRDNIKAGALVAEIETDTATLEIEAVDEGVIEKLLFAEGEETIKVNTPITIPVKGINNE